MRLPMAYGIGGSDPFSAPMGVGNGLRYPLRYAAHIGFIAMLIGSASNFWAIVSKLFSI